MPKAAVGTKYDGLAHVCDWRATYAMGVAGVTKAEIASMEQAPFQDESTDHWAAITAGGVAPRTELIHAVHSPKYCKPHDPSHSLVVQMLWLAFDSARTVVSAMSPSAQTPAIARRALGAGETARR